jgi:hypothetical protein
MKKRIMILAKKKYEKKMFLLIKNFQKIKTLVFKIELQAKYPVGCMILN